MVHDIMPFEHEFFLRIAEFFPFLKILTVINFHSQVKTNNNPLYSIVEYPNLISLYLWSSHDDYIEQFLHERRAHLPRLTKLAVNYDRLVRVTHNFTRNTAQHNIAQVKELIFERILVLTNHVYNYFPLLESCFSYH